MPNTIENTNALNKAISEAFVLCNEYRHQFLQPEHLLVALVNQTEFCIALYACSGDDQELRKQLEEQLQKQEQMPKGMEYVPEVSEQFRMMMERAIQHVQFSSAELLDVPHVIEGMLELPDSWAAYLLRREIDDQTELLSELIESYSVADEDDDEEDDDDTSFGGHAAPWRSLVTCMNDIADTFNPLIGREQEMERTIQVLCRADKNNPLHVGEPGVGKTALVYGLAARINRGDVPERLKKCRIYQMDMGTMLAGTQYRGDFEKRVKQVMEGLQKEGNAIVYIDEIHNLIGAGRGGDGSLDASNMLKPYLERGDIRFIGSTTYDEFNRYFARSRGIVRRFQQIDIAEPSVAETVAILNGLKGKYEQFHHVTYGKGVIEFAVQQSAKYMNDRFLPDKAVDLIDEAGAYRELHPASRAPKNRVDKALISEILAKLCKIDAEVMKEEDNGTLATLQDRILSRIFGQDEAVRQVVESVQMAKAGLMEDNKPLSCLLFVGPTGVGKTEVARVLAQELGVSLVRFDMSEYTERHAVAKLIGSPAGYVGYEDGGLLTDAIRKTPNCVLLLDEIEKAHQDIYNILLQVMDYACLTDNRGQKADFRNVIVLMTSNAGAQYASQANIGFSGKVSRGEAMLSQVKKTFKPEFLNRLSGTVVFRDMDHDMASRILDKKLKELQKKLDARQVTLSLTDASHDFLLQKGFTHEYGAREMDRMIAREVKPLLMREILFGGLQKGGKASLDVTEGKLHLNIEE